MGALLQLINPRPRQQVTSLGEQPLKLIVIVLQALQHDCELVLISNNPPRPQLQFLPPSPSNTWTFSPLSLLSHTLLTRLTTLFPQPALIAQPLKIRNSLMQPGQNLNR